MKPSIADIRKEYRLQSLDEADTAADPFTQFDRWWAEAIASEITEVNAMTLATATKEGIPSARIVLLKGYDSNGFIFYTNYNSHKGLQLADNPHASLVFFWKELERQVRIDGPVEKTSAETSDAYFLSRPKGSRIGAWASPQSHVIRHRREIEERVLSLESKYGEEVPRPPHWGGYIVRPEKMEFWQGRSSRLHDRIAYSRWEEEWTRERLAP